MAIWGGRWTPKQLKIKTTRRRNIRNKTKRWSYYMVKVTEDVLLSNLFDEWLKLIQKTPTEKQYINVNVIYSWAHIGHVGPYRHLLDYHKRLSIRYKGNLSLRACFERLWSCMLHLHFKYKHGILDDLQLKCFSMQLTRLPCKCFLLFRGICWATLEEFT